MKSVKEENKLIHSTRKINKAKQLTVRIAEEMTVKGHTLWGLFSGVTKYTNRDLGSPKRENGLLESKIIGKAKRIDNKVFSNLVNVIDVKDKYTIS